MRVMSEGADWHASVARVRADARRLRAEALCLSQETRSTLEAATAALRALQRTHARVHAALSLTPRVHLGPVASEPRSPLLEAMAAAGLDESDLDDLTESLCAAHHAATVRGDDEIEACLRATLTAVGRYLATGVGPKAAGVILS